MKKKKIIILGVSSYIGTFFQMYLEKEHPGEYETERVTLRGDDWRQQDWSGCESVVNVTGKAHADIGGLAENEKLEYDEINCQLAHQAAQKAIADGVKQYIYFSSVIVYGDSSSGKKSREITRATVPAPSNFYGASKWRAEQKLSRLFAQQAGADGATRLVILRPPMIYGPGCKGNYRILERMAGRLPVFPGYSNKRSVLYIENLCELLYLLIKNQESGIFFPQNREYAETAELVRLIGEAEGKKIYIAKWLAPVVAIGKRMPGKLGGMVKKAFGSLTYEQSMSEYHKGDYQKYSLRESIQKSTVFSVSVKTDEAQKAAR